MSDLMPGQKIQRLVTEAVRNAYDKGRQVERERIINLLPEIFETYFARDQIIEQTTKRIRKGVQK